MSDDGRLAPTAPAALDAREDGLELPAPSARSARPVDPGRLGVYTALGAATGVVPLPWVPDALTRRVRGALAQDIARRHGLALPRDARDVLAEPSGTEGPRGLGGQVLRFALGKVASRFGPLGFVAPVKSALETFVLGHLLNRYLDVGRRERGRRIDVVEARRVRRVIDRALLAALTVDVATHGEGYGPLPGDDRDAVTAVVDAVLSRAAGVPAWVVQRLEAAFDELLPEEER